MRFWKPVCLTVLLLCLLLLTACGGQTAEETTPSEDAPSAETPEDTGRPAENPEDTGKPAETQEDAVSLFAEMPLSYMFCSGAGAWSTTLDIDETGAFHGVFLDSDMGDSGEGYPAGTRYVCEFSGQFTEPVQEDETTWTMEIAHIELEHPADNAEEFADDARYVYTGPYGLEEAEELRIYLPDTPADSLPEGFVHWIQGPYDWTPTDEGTLGIWGIYNVKEELGFTVYPWV